MDKVDRGEISNNMENKTVRCKVLAPFRLSATKYEAGQEAEFSQEHAERFVHLLAPIEGQAPHAVLPEEVAPIEAPAEASGGLEAPPSDKMIKKNKVTKKMVTRKGTRK